MRAKLMLTGLAVMVAAAGPSLFARQAAEQKVTDGYVGSASCRGCHQQFYQLWSTSHHGLAMQPYSAEFARRAGIATSPEIAIGRSKYKAELTGEGAWIVERRAACAVE